jgi:hypothetical protein
MEHGFGSDSAADHRLQSGLGGVGNDLGVDLVASFEQTRRRSSCRRLLGLVCRARDAGPKYDSSASTSPWNGELRSQASAIPLRILRKIVFTDRTEMPVMTAVCVVVRSNTK